MKITDVIGVKWLTPEKTVLGGTVVSPVFGSVPICVHDLYDTEQGQRFWDNAIAGVYGPIFDYAEPEALPEAIPDEISRRQFFQYLHNINIISKSDALAAMQNGAIPAPLQAIIDDLPTEEEKFDAQMFVVGAQNFHRQHWLTDRVCLAMQWNAEQRDDFWRDAHKV